MVGIVVVAHSEELARGAREVTGEIADHALSLPTSAEVKEYLVSELEQLQPAHADQ